jgi:uncharacterized membrane protein YhaH (DUF805 family)
LDFQGAVASAFRNYANFSGRASRSEFWWFTLFWILVVLASVVVDRSGALPAVATLALLLPNLAVSVRRLHDVAHSGWWLLLGIVPFGSLVILVFFVLDGTLGSNAWGPRPGGDRPGWPGGTPILGIADELEKLDRLRGSSTISEEEYQRLRGRLLPP